MQLKDYLIALIVFGVVVTAFWYSFVDLGNTYNVNVSSEYANAYRNISNTMEETRGDATDIRDDIRSSEAASTEQDQYGGTIIKGAFNSLRLVWNSFTSVNVIVEQVQDRLGIPNYLILALTAIIIILISFAIISAVFKHPL
ncbi:hypothetical protein ES702_04938 [subsurface metagenome]